MTTLLNTKQVWLVYYWNAKNNKVMVIQLYDLYYELVNKFERTIGCGNFEIILGGSKI